MAAAEDDVLKKLRRAAASGVGASGRLSAERVQTVLRHAREVLLSYERSYGTDDFLNNTFQAGDMKCFEFEVNRFSSGVLGVDTTSCAIDDDDEKPSEELKELVARKHWLRLQDWEHNDAVLTAKTAPITTMLCRLDPDSSLDLEHIRFYQATHDFYFKQYRAFRKRCNEELVRIEGELEPLNFSDLPDVDECGLIDLDGNKVGPAGLEELDGGGYRAKLILKDPVAGTDIRGIGSGVADINERTEIGTLEKSCVASSILQLACVLMYPKSLSRSPRSLRVILIKSISSIINKFFFPFWKSSIFGHSPTIFASISFHS